MALSATVARTAPPAPMQDHFQGEDFASLLDETLGQDTGFDGSVVTGRVLRLTDEFAIVDVGLKSRGPRRAEGIRPARRQARGQARRRHRALCRALRGQGRRDHPVAREGPPRGGLDQPRKGVRDPAARQRHDLWPGQGRLHRRSRRRRGVPARQPGRYPPGARRRPADGHAAAVPDPQDGPRARQHRGLPPRRAGRDPRRAAQRADPGPEGRHDPRRRGEEHHRLRRLRRSRRRRWPAARHRHRLAAHQPSVRGAADRPAGQGAGDPLQPGDPAHQPRHEAARGRSVGGRRREIPAGREIHRPRHQHHRLRRLRGAGAGGRGPGARLARCPGPRRTSIPARSSPPARKWR